MVFETEIDLAHQLGLLKDQRMAQTMVQRMAQTMVQRMERMREMRTE
jgi:hypothetical protein